MTDRHRRKLDNSDEESEGSLTESDVEADDAADVAKSLKGKPEKDDELKPVDGSEYESVEEEEDDKTAEKAAEDDGELVDEEGGVEDVADEVEGEFLSDEPGSDDDNYVEEERQQGDGEECSPKSGEKELDFDEDRRNPQYIPKKGIFYEHDDRNGEEMKEEEVRDKKKKLWLDEGKWSHDRFREEEQCPKQRHELLDIYGYDIRSEEGPPRARRRRRYGRGPTKYERNWEEEDSYDKSPRGRSSRGMSRGRRPRAPFRRAPAFRGRRNSDSDSRTQEENVVPPEDPPKEDQTPSKPKWDNWDSDDKENDTPVINKQDFPALPTKAAEISPEKPVEKRPSVENGESVRTLTFENSNLGSKPSQYEVPPRYSRSAPRRRGSRGGPKQVSPRFMEQNRVNALHSAMEHLSVQDTEENAGGTSKDSSGRPKRYSSLRQRSMPETNSYQPRAPFYEPV